MSEHSDMHLTESPDQKLKLLIVDDEEIIRNNLAKLLSKDFKVETASSFDEGSGKFLSHNPDIIIADYLLPGQNGLELLKSIGKISPATVRILVSGHVDWKLIQPAFDNNWIHSCYLKPWDNETFRLQMLQASQLARIFLEKAELQQQAITDPITNLKNFRYFESCLGTELERAKRHNRPLGLLMIDIDHFKEYNDSEGHPQGNSILFKISRLFEKHLRNFDVVCRYGGEEFSVILPDTDLKSSELVAERLRSAVEKEFSKDKKPITISLGISNFPLMGKTYKAIIEGADQALYRAKEMGRNKIVTAGRN
jgi:diguanylate cyclase (GGDEF)-like protein